MKVALDRTHFEIFPALRFGAQDVEWLTLPIFHGKRGLSDSPLFRTSYTDLDFRFSWLSSPEELHRRLLRGPVLV
jgi:hypothetical protein